MALSLKTPPAVEPVSLAEAKLHLRLDSGYLADNITTMQSIAPGGHVIAAGYSLVGTGVDVLGYRALVNLNSGANGAGGTVDAKIQEAAEDSDAKYSDWAGGSFTQVTTANDNVVQKIEYTGAKQYIRVVATVAGAACDFGADVIREQPYSAEDSLIDQHIKVAREDCEDYQNRSYITQERELWLDRFPVERCIEIPKPPLQSVTSIEYYDTDNVKHTMPPGDYFVDPISFVGRVGLAYGKHWPNITLRPANGVCITFVAGYGDTADDVPAKVKQAILLVVGHLYENREEVLVVGHIAKELPMGAKHLLSKERVIPV